MAAVVAFASGEMTESDRRSFERRLANNAKLARVVESFLDMDELHWRVHEQPKVSVNRPDLTLLRWIAPLAAAAGIIFWIGRTLEPPPTPRSQFSVALVSGHLNATELASAMKAEPPPDLIRGNGENEGGTEPADFAKLAKIYDRDLALQALAKTPANSPLETGHLNIAVNLDKPHWAIVVRLSLDDGAELMFPDLPLRSGALEEAQIPSGPTVVPPSYSLARKQATSISTPFEAGIVTLLIGFREHPFDAESLEDLAASLVGLMTLEDCQHAMEKFEFRVEIAGEAMELPN